MHIPPCTHLPPCLLRRPPAAPRTLQPVREVLRPAAQLALSAAELQEEIGRSLTAGNPAAPANIGDDCTAESWADGCGLVPIGSAVCLSGSWTTLLLGSGV